MFGYNVIFNSENILNLLMINILNLVMIYFRYNKRIILFKYLNY